MTPPEKSYTAMVLHGPEDLRLESRVPTPPGEGDVQVQVVATGLCGSDLHYYQHGRNGDFALRAPLVLGHESSGVVVALGPGVTGLRVGQRVAIECGVYCGKCTLCLGGRYNLCPSMQFCSSAKTFPHRDGTLQGRMNHPARLLHPISDNTTFEQAALAEPLSVVLHASRRANFQRGQSALVLGAGAVGLLACALAKANGASRVLVVDIDPSRLEFAKEQGFADVTYTLQRGRRPATREEGLDRARETAGKLKSGTGHSDGFDVVFECTGVEPCIQAGVHCATTGGKLVLVGMGTPAALFPLSASALREVDVLGVFRYHDTYPEALRLIGSGALEGIEKMVTHRFALEDAGKAFELISKGGDEQSGMVIKVMVGRD
ncbi:GroES-like protein [Dacryopinax primogenitus]|uniref:GroES-like protein n=1 Tax=Dacryopinax primogenitus (strain DJM 731) TaxID=1858805 RepID=M5FWL5_DACPD|nr:GroES-like protein [Dacryopinax primogenitus]EJU02336.1 GroES-like protein [Dacryopinax primogenitus]